MRLWLSLCLFGLGSCTFFQDAVPGGVCSWVERDSARENCAESTVTIESSTSANDYDTRTEFGAFGLLSFREITGRAALGGVFELERDDRGRIVELSRPSGEFQTRVWDGCFAGTFSVQPEGGLRRDGSFTFRDGEFESYVLTDPAAVSYAVQEYDTVYNGSDLVRIDVRNDGELQQRTEFTYSEVGGNTQVQEVLEYPDGSQFSRTVTVYDDDERVIRLEEYDREDELDSFSTAVYTETSIAIEVDEDGDGQLDYTDDVTLDDEGRRTRTERVSVEEDGDFDFVRTHTWVCE